MNMSMYIIMSMNIYITKENEKYLRSLGSSMSGYINGLIEMDRADAKLVKKSVVEEGIELGILDAPVFDKEVKIEDVCTGHPNFRRNCGLKGCKYA